MVAIPSPEGEPHTGSTAAFTSPSDSCPGALVLTHPGNPVEGCKTPSNIRGHRSGSGIPSPGARPASSKGHRHRRYIGLHRLRADVRHRQASIASSIVELASGRAGSSETVGVQSNVCGVRGSRERTAVALA
jgi:hypothetical protein